MTCTKRLRILFFTLSLSLFFPKQKRAWGGWCLIPLRVLELGDQPGWSPGWWASPCPGAESRALNHHGAQGACAGAPRVGISGPCSSAPGGKLLPIAQLWWGVVLVVYVVCAFFFFFLRSQDHFSFPLRVKTKGKNSWEIKWHWRNTVSDSQSRLGFLLFHQKDVLRRAGRSGKPAGHQHPAVPHWP